MLIFIVFLPFPATARVGTATVAFDRDKACIL